MKRRLIKNNVDEIVKILLGFWGKKYNGFFRFLYHQHPLFPSYQAISYILSKEGIDSVLIETSQVELRELPCPFIINYDGLFLPISKMRDGNSVTIINETGKEEDVDLIHLNKLWDNTALILNVNNNAIPQTNHQKIEWLFNLLLRGSAILAVVILFLCFIFLRSKDFSLINYVYLVSISIGIVVSILFHIRQLDRKNPLVNKICHTRHHKQTDCSSILDSKASLLGGIVSWVDIGSIYFVLLFVIEYSFPPNPASTLLCILSLASATFIPYSLLYQWRIAHTWCPLCLIIQVILLFNAILSGFILFNHPYLFDYIHVLDWKKCCVAFLLAYMGYYFLKNTIYNENIMRKKERWINSIKHSYDGKQLLLYSTRTFDFRSLLRKEVMSSGGNDSITMIVNPSCSPCMKKLREMFYVLGDKRSVDFFLVFLVDENDNETMSLASEMLNMTKAEIEQYAENFPKSKYQILKKKGSVSTNNPILQSQIRWCISNKITSTPQIIINGYLMTQDYDIRDLDYLVS